MKEIDHIRIGAIEHLTARLIESRTRDRARLPMQHLRQVARVRVQVWGFSIAFLIVGWAGLAQPVQPYGPTHLFTTNTTITSSGLAGQSHVLLSLTNVTSINVPLGTAGGSPSASFTFTSTASVPFNNTYQGSSTWVEPPIPGEEFGLQILSLPEDQIAPTNGEAIFTIQAVALANPTNSISYQWLKNEEVISGATNYYLHLVNVQTNVDVGFYACDLQTGTNAVYRARSKECDAPGARLFVYSGTNTPVTGPYQPAPRGSSSGSCPGAYIGWVQFRNPEATSRFYGTTYFDKPSWAAKCTATDQTVRTGYTSRIFAFETGTTKAPVCGSSPISINPADAPPRLYQFTIYVTSSSTPISTGSSITLNVNWQP